jgi:hypothetical protein
MPWIRNVFQEIAGLFVDDGSLALAVTLWVALLWLFRGRLIGFAPGGIILFCGLAIILAENLIRSARRRSK